MMLIIQVTFLIVIIIFCLALFINYIFDISSIYTLNDVYDRHKRYLRLKNTKVGDTISHRDMHILVIEIEMVNDHKNNAGRYFKILGKVIDTNRLYYSYHNNASKKGSIHNFELYDFEVVSKRKKIDNWKKVMQKC